MTIIDPNAQTTAAAAPVAPAAPTVVAQAAPAAAPAAMPALEPGPETRVPASFLVHGPSKIGKSSLLLTCPGLVLVADIEGQLRFLPMQERRYKWDMVSPFAPPPGTKWVTVRVRTYSQIEQLYTLLCNPNHPFSSFAIDSITELQQKYIDQIAGSDQMQTQDWGELLRGLASMIRKFRDLLEEENNSLECLLITSMTKTADNKHTVMVQGQLSKMIPYFTDVVGYFEPINDVANGVKARRLQMEPSPFYEAGSRIPWTPDFVDNPSIASIMTPR